MNRGNHNSIGSRLRALSWTEWRTLAIATILLPIVDLALNIWGFRWVYAWMSRLSPTPDPAIVGQSLDQVDEIARSVNRAARRGLRPVTCLRRSLLFWWLLRWHGTASEIRIGVRFESHEFLAHAWVERDGVILNDRADIGERFAVFEQDASLQGMKWV